MSEAEIRDDERKCIVEEIAEMRAMWAEYIDSHASLAAEQAVAMGMFRVQEAVSNKTFAEGKP